MSNLIQWADFIYSPDQFEEKMATRDAYGKALLQLGKENEKIVALDADLSGSTRTGWFKKEFPERFINAGIAEQNLVGLAAGMSLGGNIPFVSSFAVFLSGRAWEIIRQSICYPKLNVKLVSSHSGLTVGEDGASHQGLEDIALMRVLPNMRVLVPADKRQAQEMVRFAADSEGPIYIRTGRPSVFTIYKDNYHYDPDRIDELVKGKDILIITAGVLVSEALQACSKLARENIFPGLMNLHTIKPLNEKALVEITSRYKKIITFEEHSKYGGLGSTVTEVMSANQPMPVFINGTETFGKSGKPADLLRKFELDSEGISKKVMAIADVIY